MSSEIVPEEHLGPMNPVETLLLRGDGARHDQDIKNLKEVIRNLEASLVAKRRELADFQGKKLTILRAIVRGRGKEPGALPIRVVDRPHDGSTWVVVGGRPEDS